MLVDVVVEQSRTVVAENLPEDHSIESMEQLFGKVGPVKMVRICYPEGANGANSTAAKHPKTDMVVSNKVGVGLLQGLCGGVVCETQGWCMS